MNPLVMDDVLKVIHRLPSLPTVIMELLASLDHEDTDVDTLACKIEQDQVLTAKALRLANSSFYGRAHAVHTMTEAIAILGFRTVRSVVTTAGLMQSLRHDGEATPDLQPFWRHAIAVAVCARELAPYLHVNPDHAYTAGLLHDIGRLVLVTQLWDQYAQTVAYRVACGCSTLEAERKVLGLDHAAIGQALTAHWKFPVHLQFAVGKHHAEDVPAEESLTLVVMAADAIAHALDLSMDPDDAVPEMLPQLWTRLGVDDKTLLYVLSRVENQFAAASQVLQT
jgi:putative nucleotidyltransferase with HDIG domain